jgi:hypothetical protein
LIVNNCSKLKKKDLSKKGARCNACRFDRCLALGMAVETIRLPKKLNRQKVIDFVEKRRAALGKKVFFRGVGGGGGLDASGNKSSAGMTPNPEERLERELAEERDLIRLVQNVEVKIIF